MLEGIGVATLVWVCAEAVRDRHAARLSDTPPFEHSDESAATP